MPGPRTATRGYRASSAPSARRCAARRRSAIPRSTSRGGRSRICGGTTSSQRGYTVVVWRDGHVVEPLDLSDEAAAAYWADVLRVGRAIRDHLSPKTLKHETQENHEPHLHTHVVPRHEDDPNAGGGFPFWRVHDPPPIPAEESAVDVAALRALLSQG